MCIQSKAKNKKQNEHTATHITRCATTHTSLAAQPHTQHTRTTPKRPSNHRNAPAAKIESFDYGTQYLRDAHVNHSFDVHCGANHRGANRPPNRNRLSCNRNNMRSTPRNDTPCHAMSRHVTPRHAMSRHAMPCHARQTIPLRKHTPQKMRPLPHSSHARKRSLENENATHARRQAHTHRQSTQSQMDRPAVYANSPTTQTAHTQTRRRKKHK